jgi:hypothetical protein
MLTLYIKKKKLIYRNAQSVGENRVSTVCPPVSHFWSISQTPVSTVYKIPMQAGLEQGEFISLFRRVKGFFMSGWI